MCGRVHVGVRLPRSLLSLPSSPPSRSSPDPTLRALSSLFFWLSLRLRSGRRVAAGARAAIMAEGMAAATVGARAAAAGRRGGRRASGRASTTGTTGCSTRCVARAAPSAAQRHMDRSSPALTRSALSRCLFTTYALIASDSWQLDCRACSPPVPRLLSTACPRPLSTAVPRPSCHAVSPPPAGGQASRPAGAGRAGRRRLAGRHPAVGGHQGRRRARGGEASQ